MVNALRSNVIPFRIQDDTKATRRKLRRRIKDTLSKLTTQPTQVALEGEMEFISTASRDAQPDRINSQADISGYYHL